MQEDQHGNTVIEKPELMNLSHLEAFPVAMPACSSPAEFHYIQSKREKLREKIGNTKW